MRGGRGAFRLGPRTVLHPRSARFGGRCETSYEDVTHVVATRRALRFGTGEGVFWLGRNDLAEPERLTELGSELRARALAAPGGAARGERMERLDAAIAEPRPLRVVPLFLLTLFGMFFLQVLDPEWTLSGAYHAAMLEAGEWWRVVTAHFLHAFPAHLLGNALAIWVFGALCERMLGRTVFAALILLSGIGAVAGMELAGYDEALGASGIAAGLVGALLVLELRRPERLPAPWRFPRRLFLGVVALEAAFTLLLPQVAHAAHIGGALAGAATALVWTGPVASTSTVARGLRGLVSVAALVALVAGLLLARAVLLPSGEQIVRRAEVLLERVSTAPVVLNNEAWRIATSEAPSGSALDVALRMAREAVVRTQGRDANFLDTLAEVYFVRGESEPALRWIDRAIAIEPGVPYYAEQRRRFTGERARLDRPAAPEQRPRRAIPEPLPALDPSRSRRI